MRFFRFHHLILFTVLFAWDAHAVNLGSQTFTLDGRLFSDTALTTPLLDASVLVDVKILDPSKTCVLYEEHQTVSTATTNGYFNIQVGSLTSDGKRAGS